MRVRAVWCVVMGAVFAVAACSSDKGAQGGGGGRGHAPQPQGMDLGGAKPEEAAQVMLDCARLTFVSTEQAFWARIYFNAQGQLTGLGVGREDGGAPPELLCPADRPLVERVTAGRRGAPWGGRPAQGYQYEAYCAPGFDESSSGCALSMTHLYPETYAAAAPSPKAPAPSSPSSTPRPSGGAITGMPTVPEIPALVPAERPRHYRLSRHGTDIPASEGMGVESQLRAVDYAIELCMHSLQLVPPDKSSIPIVVRVHVEKDSRMAVAPFEVVVGKPDAWWGAVGDCVRSMTDHGSISGHSFHVNYTVVMEDVDRVPARYVQQLAVENAREAVSLAVEPNVRREMTTRLLGAIKGCAEARPIAYFGGTDGWTNLPALYVVGTVEANRRDKLVLQELRFAPEVDRNARVPPYLQPVVDCVTVQLAPNASSAPAAHVEWTFNISVAPILESQR